ncbi:TPA: RHS repeat-associated core domain-containing protein [Pseudomonas putida]|nr:RHS repeat-associated core domain-containing protein [Pseudomonas putida]
MNAMKSAESDAESAIPIGNSHSIAVSLVYTPYGHESAGGSVQEEVRFVGQLHHRPLTGYLLGNGHRLYHPGIFRFSSPDQQSPFAEGGVNAYAYCAGDPVNYLDISGRNRGRVMRSSSLPRVSRPSVGSTPLKNAQSWPALHPETLHGQATKFTEYLKAWIIEDGLQDSIHITAQAEVMAKADRFNWGRLGDAVALEVTQAIVDTQLSGGFVHFSVKDDGLFMRSFPAEGLKSVMLHIRGSVRDMPTRPV